MRTSRIIPSVLFLLLCAISRATVFRVWASAAPGGDGSTWITAFAKMENALAVATFGDEIWVAAGTYHPGAPGDIEASYRVPPGVKLLGGFSGWEVNRVDRNPSTNLTVVSGDLGEDDVFGQPIWYSGWNYNTPNTKTIFVFDQAIQNELDGFIISQAVATQTSGGGIRLNSGSVSISNCIFRRNEVAWGYGGCILALGELKVRNCQFMENWGHLSNGAAIAANGTGSVDAYGCIFYDNHVTGDPSSGNGAALNLYGEGNSVIRGCTFDRNYSLPFPVGLGYPTFGGAIHHMAGHLTVDRCKFSRNESVIGGGIHSWRTMVVSNSLFIENKAFPLGATGGTGGAINIFGYSPGEVRIIGSTFYQNSAHESGGVSTNETSALTTLVSTCIFWGNFDQNGIVSQAQVKEAEYSCVQNFMVTRPGEDPIDPEKFPNCIAASPQFLNAAAGDFRLSAKSPCIDAGDQRVFSTYMTRDLAGYPRLINMRIGGPGFGKLKPDMGSFENQTWRGY